MQPSPLSRSDLFRSTSLWRRPLHEVARRPLRERPRTQSQRWSLPKRENEQAIRYSPVVESKFSRLPVTPRFPRRIVRRRRDGKTLVNTLNTSGRVNFVTSTRVLRKNKLNLRAHGAALRLFGVESTPRAAARQIAHPSQISSRSVSLQSSRCKQVRAVSDISQIPASGPTGCTDRRLSRDPSE